ncbi:MAG: hypothetical protein U1F76_00040 [Candidatus Competibacteraceae bacterium]
MKHHFLSLVIALTFCGLSAVARPVTAPDFAKDAYSKLVEKISTAQCVELVGSVYDAAANEKNLAYSVSEDPHFGTSQAGQEQVGQVFARENFSIFSVLLKIDEEKILIPVAISYHGQVKSFNQDTGTSTLTHEIILFPSFSTKALGTFLTDDDFAQIVGVPDEKGNIPIVETLNVVGGTKAFTGFKSRDTRAKGVVNPSTGTNSFSIKFKVCR